MNNRLVCLSSVLIIYLHIRANKIRWANVGFLLAQRRRRWANINPALVPWLVLAVVIPLHGRDVRYVISLTLSRHIAVTCVMSRYVRNWFPICPTRKSRPALVHSLLSNARKDKRAEINLARAAGIIRNNYRKSGGRGTGLECRLPASRLIKYI